MYKEISLWITITVVFRTPCILKEPYVDVICTFQKEVRRDAKGNGGKPNNNSLLCCADSPYIPYGSICDPGIIGG